jgi:hypothetical protein
MARARMAFSILLASANEVLDQLVEGFVRISEKDDLLLLGHWGSLSCPVHKPFMERTVNP